MRLNPSMQEMIRKEVVTLLDAGITYPIYYTKWISLVQVIPKNGDIIVVKNDNNKLNPSKDFYQWQVYIDYRKFNDATWKDHFPLPFIDWQQQLEAQMTQMALAQGIPAWELPTCIALCRDFFPIPTEDYSRSY